MNEITLSEMARRSGLDERTLQEHAAAGRIPGARLEGGRWRVPERSFVLMPEPPGKTAEVLGKRIDAPRVPLARFGTRGRPLVLATFNFAGGVGKTSLSRDLAVLLAAAGYRVLVVDADPQANLTTYLNPATPEVIGLEQTVNRAYREKVLPEPLVLDERLHLVPATIVLSLLEQELAQNQIWLPRLHDALRATGPRYDVVVLDSPPSAGQLTMGNLIAADYALVPAETSPKGVTAAETIIGRFDAYAITKREWLRDDGARLGLAAVVPTHYDARTTGAQTQLERLRAMSSRTTPPLAQRPGPYGKALEQRTPVPLLRQDRTVRAATEELHRVTAAVVKNLIEQETEGLR